MTNIRAPLFLLLAACTLDRTTEVDDAISTTQIISTIGNKCLSDRGDATADGTPIELDACKGGDAQAWQRVGSAIVGAGGKCLWVVNNQQHAGALVELHSCNGGASETWNVVGSQIKSSGGLCLDVEGGASLDGTLIDVAVCNNSAAQTWRMSATPAPSRLAYQNQSLIITQHTALAPLTPSHNGGAPTSYSVSPPLPAGLRLDTATGVVSGTPTTPQAPIYYLVSAHNAAGTTATTVAIQIAPTGGYTAANLEELTGPAQYKTDFKTMPFGGNIVAKTNGSSAGLAPMNLFWTSGSHFTDPAMIAHIKSQVAAEEAVGMISNSGLQRWQRTYVDTLATNELDAAGCSGSSDYAAYLVERTKAPFTPLDGAMKAWRDFLRGHTDLWDVSTDGGTMPPYYRCWGGSWAWISHLTPIDTADCPSGETECVYADMEASQWGGVAKLTGVQGWGLPISTIRIPAVRITSTRA